MIFPVFFTEYQNRWFSLINIIDTEKVTLGYPLSRDYIWISQTLKVVFSFHKIPQYYNKYGTVLKIDLVLSSKISQLNLTIEYPPNITM